MCTVEAATLSTGLKDQRPVGAQQRTAPPPCAAESSAGESPACVLQPPGVCVSGLNDKGRGPMASLSRSLQLRGLGFGDRPRGQGWDTEATRRREESGNVHPTSPPGGALRAPSTPPN